MKNEDRSPGKNPDTSGRGYTVQVSAAFCFSPFWVKKKKYQYAMMTTE